MDYVWEIILLIFMCVGVTLLIRQNNFLRKQILENGKKISEDRKLIDELCIAAEYDLLSGLKNRNAFVRFADDVKRNNKHISLLVCDIDGLKIINDSLGHIAGNEIIKAASLILCKVTPKDAIVYRTGGDEYVIAWETIIPSNELENIKGQISESLSQHNINSAEIPFGISAGYSSYSKETDEFWKIYNRADKIMYAEKRKNHNAIYNMIQEAISL